MNGAAEPAPLDPCRRAVRSGAEIGAASGLLVALVDVIAAARADYVGSRAALALYVFALTVTTTTVLGALLAAWACAARRLAARLRGARSRAFLDSALCAVPLASFLLYPPGSWIAVHVRELSPRSQAISAAVLLALAAGALLAVVAGRAVAAYLRAHPRRPRYLRPALIAGSALAAAACYAADARLYPDDYAEFHDGLAGGFAMAVAACVALVRSTLPDGRPARAARRALLPIALVCALALGVLEQTRVEAFGASGALVFSKLVLHGRSLSDVDGDGYAAVLGGSDCAPFDARRSPGAAERPESGEDEDCSGKDERWPLAPPPPRAAPGARRHNVVLISIDTLRADHLGVYGYERPTSPNLDRFAAEAIVFTRAFAQSSKTWDSVPSFLTGLYPSNLPRDYKHERVRKSPPYAYYLLPKVGLLAEAFAARGYFTGAVVSVSLLRKQGIGRGFKHYKDKEKVTRDAKKLLAKARRPFFLWFHSKGPHLPYKKQRGHDFGDEPIDRYDSEIAGEDAQVGALLELLRAPKLAKSTFVIVTSDHGEEFGEHGGYAHTRKHYRELLHVPLIMKGPGLSPARVDDVVELVDLAPTLYELCNVPAPHRLDGQSLLPTLRGRRPAELGGAYAEDVQPEHGVAKRALLHGGYRLIDDRLLERRELYDVRRDPMEQRNIAARRPDVLQRMQERIAVRRLRSRSPRPAPEPSAAP